MEMLVALVVVAIGLSLAVLAFRPDARRPLALEAERLALLLEQAGEESQLGGAPLAWQWHETGYNFLRRELTDAGPQWRPLREDDLFRPRELAGGARIVSARADARLLEPGARISLGPDGAQWLELELVLDDARAWVRRREDGPGYHHRVEQGG